MTWERVWAQVGYGYDMPFCTPTGWACDMGKGKGTGNGMGTIYLFAPLSNGHVTLERVWAQVGYRGKKCIFIRFPSKNKVQ